MADIRDQRLDVVKWITKQDQLPSRKAVEAKFPSFPKKVVRKAFQSCRDRVAT